MLKALKSQLSLLAIENGAAFAERIRKRVGKKKANLYISKAMNLVMVMPDLIAKIRDLSEDERLPKKYKPLNGFLLTYLYHPIDFLKDHEAGLFGYLDDAYFVGKVYQRVHHFVPGKHGAQDLARQLPEAIEAVKQILPKESRQVDRLIEELEEGKRTLFDELMHREAHRE